MPPQKPPELDAFGRPIQATEANKPAELDAYGRPVQQEEPGFLSQVWHAINEPLTDLPSRVARKISPYFDKPEVGEAFLHGLPFNMGNVVRSMRGERAGAETGGFLRGATEGAGDVLSGFSSPLNIGATLATGGSNLAVRAGLPQVAKGFSTAVKTTGVPIMAHGVERITSPDADLSERFMGLTEVAGGRLATLHQPSPTGRGVLTGRLPDSWFPETPEATSARLQGEIPGLLERLKGSMARDRGITPEQFSQQVTGETPTPQPRPTGQETTVKLPFPQDAKAIKLLKSQGYDFAGIDENNTMTFTIRSADPNLNQGMGNPELAGSTPYKRAVEEPTTPKLPFEDLNVGDIPTQQPRLPDVDLPTGPMERGFPRPETTPEARFAFYDPYNFPTGPEPFFHLGDGSTVSRGELARRGIPEPEIPPSNQPTQPTTPPISNRDMFSLSRQVETENRPPTTFADQVLPPEFAPDITQTNEPAMGGTSPLFEPRIPTPEIPGGPAPEAPPVRQSLLSRIGERLRNFGKDESGTISFDDEGPLFSRKPKITDFSDFQEQRLISETDPTIALDNFNNLDMELKYAKLSGNPDQIEHFGFLRDVALDHYQQLTGKRLGPEEPLWSQDPNYNPELPISSTIGDRLRQKGKQLRERGFKTPEGFGNEPRPLPPAGELVNQAQGLIESQIKADVRHSAKELTSGYNQPLPAVMAREGLQNALDAFTDRPMSDIPGMENKINVSIADDHIRVTDNGKGMTPQELNTVFTTLHGSGKRNDPTAKGGKGVGKAPYLLGGSNFEIQTVALVNGQKIESSFSGTPDAFFEPGGIKIQYEVVHPDTPTGTTFKTTFAEGQSRYDASNMLAKIQRWSRDIPHELEFNRYGMDEAAPINSKANDRSIIKETIGDGVANVEVLIPQEAKTRTSNYIDIHYLNDGFYQFDDNFYLGEDTPGVPDHIIVDLKSLVPESDSRYPFPVQRESIKANLNKEINELIKNKLVNPFANQKRLDLAKLWNQMPVLDNPEGTRPTVLFDPGDRLTPQERALFQDSPIIQELTQTIDDVIEEALGATGHNHWRSKLERVGIILSNPGEYGIHIPNPLAPKDAPKSAILINPFASIESPRSMSPADAAVDITSTMLHEVAHIGTENPKSLPQIKPEDLDDPRVGRYLQGYLKEVMEQGGIDQGHGFSFVHRLGEVYATYGTRKGLSAATRIQNILQDPNTGGYRPEVQELLRIHQEARGRTATTEDILSGTGVRSADTGAGGTGNVPGDDSGLRGGASRVKLRRQHATPERVREVKARGYEWEGLDDEGNFLFTKKGKPSSQPILESDVGESRPRGTRKPDDPTLLGEVFNVPRTLLASNDLSAPLRQGIGLVHRGEFWKALPAMFKSWASEGAYAREMATIEAKPLFRKRYDAKGNELPSFADDAGLELTDTVNHREELFVSKLAQKFPGVKRSNRAYTIFLNKLRADTFDALIRDAKVFGADGTKNLPLSRDIAKFVNIATGRGPLGALEPAAKALNYGLFAPRLISARLQMLNPHYYWAAPPFVRKEALKSLFAIAAVGNVITQLGKWAGGEVSSDPSSSDFGKLKIGDTRVDPYGGFQQYIVAANRLLNPLGPVTGFEGDTPFTRGQMVTSSTDPNNEYDLWNQQGPYDPSWGDVAGRFIRGKVHPVIGFAWSLVSGKKELSGEKMKFGLDAERPMGSFMENSIAQRFIPIFLQDMYELAQNDELPPQIKAMVATLSLFGMGQQTYGPKGD